MISLQGMEGIVIWGQGIYQGWRPVQCWVGSRPGICVVVIVNVSQGQKVFVLKTEFD